MKKLVAPVLTLALLGCVQGHDVDADADVNADTDAAGPGDVSEASDEICKTQIEGSPDSLPDELKCLGLYANVAEKTLAEDVRPYTPGARLWSDGSQKYRFVYLPKGEKIDASDPDSWVFPEGTSFYKEFRTADDKKKVETRVYRKLEGGRWVRATYVWNADDTAAERHYGGELKDTQLAGFDYQVPTGSQCNQCHNGHSERVMGFDQVSLGLPEAAGVTLKTLVDDDLIDPPPADTSLSLADDGTGLANQVYPFFHANCGVSCHNDNQNAEGYVTGLYLRLRVSDFDKASSSSVDAYRLTRGQPGSSTWRNNTRAIPGDPAGSLLVKLISTRMGPGVAGDANKVQMPPVGSLVVDEEHLTVIEDWVRAMEPTSEVEGPE